MFKKYKSSEIQNIFKLYESPLRALHDHFMQYNEFKLDANNVQFLGYKGFMQFIN